MRATTKFVIYTLAGSLLMLAAAIALFLVLRSVAGSNENLTSVPESADAVGPAEAILLGDELAQSIYQGDSPTLLQAAFGYEEQIP